MSREIDPSIDASRWIEVSGDENCDKDFTGCSVLEMVTDGMMDAYYRHIDTGCINTTNIDTTGLTRYLKALAVKLHEVAQNVDYMADNADLCAMILALESEGQL